MMRGSTVLYLGAAICALLCFETGLRSGSAEAASQNERAVAIKRSTPAVLRVGMWTLWHDREVAVLPTGSTTLRTCARCAGHPLKHGLVLHAVRNSVAGASPTPQAVVWIDGTVTLRAHGESETLHHPLTATARDGELFLAVTLPVESYVERVAASESGPNDTLESLKALAIVVRTYALHVPHGHREYDLCDSTHCQLLHWHGVPNRTAAAHAATLATAGETLWFHNQPALAYFNKDCGGFTAAPNQIWPNARAVDYLPARPDPYCARRGGNDWATELSRQDIASALAVRGLAPRGWQSLLVGRRAAYGRALTVRLDAREIPAEEFRLAIGAALGWNRIPSTWFEVSEQAQNFYFHGRGEAVKGSRVLQATFPHEFPERQERSSTSLAQGRA
ncbi:MAG: SpoIID/LytB domain-containing protein [Acidobacteriota bacterium]